MEGLIQRLQQTIDESGLTVHAVGKLAGMTQGHLAHILSGRRQTITAETLLGLSRALDVSADWLLTGEGPRRRQLAPPAPSILSSEPVAEKAAQRAAALLEELRSELARMQPEAAEQQPPAKKKAGRRH